VHAEGEDSSTLANLLSEDHSYPEKQGKHCILLEPYDYRWFRIGGLDYLLKRYAV
jgi:maltose alpha-D-glucosyltransferase / alpha-amylase